MFVGDEQHTQCALVVLGKDDLLQAKKELDRHQIVKQCISSKHLDASSSFLRIIWRQCSLPHMSGRHRVAPQTSDNRLQKGARQR